jgi:hypothetical protein
MDGFVFGTHLVLLGLLPVPLRYAGVVVVFFVAAVVAVVILLLLLLLLCAGVPVAGGQPMIVERRREVEGLVEHPRGGLSLHYGRILCVCGCCGCRRSSHDLGGARADARDNTTQRGPRAIKAK